MTARRPTPMTPHPLARRLTSLGASLLVIASAASLLGAQGTPARPVVVKVDPPSWWTGSTVNPVRVMIRGTHLTGARLECGAVLRCGNLKVNEAGTYLFADVTIPGGAVAKPGRYALVVANAGGRDTARFEVTAPLPKAGRFRGFDANDVIYLLMPDRFANGDPSNDDPRGTRILNRQKVRYYHGGDLAGVRQRLPYLKSLGITAIWMNPIYDNNDRLNEKEQYEDGPITDYHGYGATDFYAVDEHLGTLDEFRQLVDEAHALGIKIILDQVANHSGPYHPWVTDPPTPTWYNGTAATHLANTWQTWTLADPYGDKQLRKETLDGWFINILPDLNQSDPEARRYIIQNALWWVGMSGLDGIRQDTWPYVPREFWRDWMRAIKKEFPTLKVVGEVFDGDPTMIAFFQGGVPQFDGIDTGVDALFDFPLYFEWRKTFAQGQSIRGVAQMLGRDRLYTHPSSLVTFLGLHDVGRFMGEKGASVDGLTLAFTAMLTTRGTPLIYYGDEIGMPGGGDPDNRRDFPGGWPTDPRNAFEPSGRTADERRIHDHVQRLLRLRQERADLRTGETETLLLTEQQWVYRRGTTLIALNNDTLPAVVRIPVGALGEDLLGRCGTPETAGRHVMTMIPARAACILPITSLTVPGPSLGVTGERQVLQAFPSAHVPARQVEVWLPPGYGRDTTQRYPVLYLHDGQNVFDPATAFGGVDWGIDETMTRLIAERRVRPAIVVAVWNSPARAQEYMGAKLLPAGSSSFTMGSGLPPMNGPLRSEAYLRFLTEELKPFIDRRFRTRPGREDTMVMGSSMGGLISLYALGEHPHVFGAAASLSTHWPAGDGAMLRYLETAMPDPATHRVYLDHGTRGLDAAYGPYQARAEALFRAKGYEGRQLMSRVVDGAEHNERAWRVRADEALRFLLGPAR